MKPNQTWRIRLLLLALVAGGYRFEYLRFLPPAAGQTLLPGNESGLDRRPLHERLDPLPDDLVALFAEGARRTSRDDSVRFLAPPAESGLSYAYYRAGHALAGRRLLPPESAASAKWILAWRRPLDPPGYERVWNRRDATLLVAQGSGRGGDSK